MSRNPPRVTFAPITRTPAGWFRAGALERRWNARAGTVRLMEGFAVKASAIVAHTRAVDFGRIYRPDGSRVGFKGGDDGCYSVRPNAIRAASPEFRAWLSAWQRRVAASERRSAKVTPTLAQLSAVVRDREARIRAWANAVDWRVRS